MRTERYQQKTFFGTGLPLFAAALPFLLASLYLLLKQTQLPLCILLLTIGLLFIMASVWQTKRNNAQLLQFVRQNSTFTHQCQPSLKIDSLLHNLQQQAFELTEYPFGNYHAYRQLDKKHGCHFFLANNNAPDCPETEEYSKLFIKTVFETGLSAGNRYLLNLEYGAEIAKNAPEYIKVARDGFMCDKSGTPFGFRLAYDTKSNVLYWAEAVTDIDWHKSEVLAIYTAKLLRKLFS